MLIKTWLYIFFSNQCCNVWLCPTNTLTNGRWGCFNCALNLLYLFPGFFLFFSLSLFSTHTLSLYPLYRSTPSLSRSLIHLALFQFLTLHVYIFRSIFLEFILHNTIFCLFLSFMSVCLSPLKLFIDSPLQYACERVFCLSLSLFFYKNTLINKIATIRTHNYSILFWA